MFKPFVSRQDRDISLKKGNYFNDGFTLFELLVSISIIGIMTALAVISYSSAQKKARDARRIEDMKNVQSAAEQYYSVDAFTYPANTAPASWKVGNQQILEAFPTDPKETGWTGYTYLIGTTYCACAAVENKNSGNSTNNNCNVGATGPYFCVKSQQ